MNILNSIKKLIPIDTSSVLEIEENFSNFKATLKLSKSIIAESNLIEAIINTVESNDSLFTFNVKYDDSEEISLDPNDIDSFIAELNNYTDLFDINSMILRIIISKEKYNSSVNIYSIEHFSSYLLTDNPSIILNILSDKYSDNYIIFNIVTTEFINSVKSSSFIIKSSNSTIDCDDFIYNNTLINNFKRECTHIATYKHMFTPYDFKIDISGINTILNMAFSKLRNILSIIFIFNISELSSNLNLKINGYKNMNLNINFTDLNRSSLNIYYNIFDWAYNDGNLSDKINIARNILSLYLKDDNKLDVDTSVLSAIQSNHSLYLKSNVENYFEIKTKVIDNIINTNNQISDMINDLASNFMKNLSAIGTFIITIIIVNSINDGKFKDIFTKDITYISLFLLIVSLLYLIYTCHEYNSNKKRIETIYNRQKENYKDILTETEVNELLKNNEYYNTDMDNANTKRKFYCILWCIFLFVFLILLFILGFIPLFKTQK